MSNDQFEMDNATPEHLDPIVLQALDGGQIIAVFFARFIEGAALNEPELLAEFWRRSGYDETARALER